MIKENLLKFYYLYSSNMEDISNDILKRELTIKGKNNKSFKLIITKEKDEIRFESYILDDICNIQYTKNLHINIFYEYHKIFKKFKSIYELYSEIFKNIKEEEIIMSLNIYHRTKRNKIR